MQRIIDVCLRGVLVLAAMAATAAAETPPAATAEPPVTAVQEAYFEKSVRPLLIAKCFDCHGPTQQKGDLRLDSRAALLKGNDAGPAVVPGKPEESRLIEVLSHTDAIKMPPKGKLPDEEIAVLTHWVKLGAPFPALPGDKVKAGPGPATPEGIATAREQHWSLQPIARPVPPEVPTPGTWTAPIDRFLLEKLQAAGLSPAPPADRRTLLRRVTFDLIGLPPTAEEVAAFEEDSHADAFATVVDRLLSSPRYGERWGRHWLDIARYADTKGYVFTEERKYAYSYTYRDYVIDAFNADVPFNQFVVEQLAADRLPAGDDHRALAALGYLTLGRRFGNNTHDIIDDRIDVVTRGLMGLTVTCARCHDHKYDPIPTEDYYSLYGVFASTVEPTELPLIAAPVETPAYVAYKTELDKREQAVGAFVNEKRQALLDELRGQATDYLVAVVRRKMGEQPIPDDVELSLSAGEIRPQIVNRWDNYLRDAGNARPTVFEPWSAFVGFPAAEAPSKSKDYLASLAAATASGNARPMNPRLRQALLDAQPTSLLDIAGVYGKLLGAVHKEWQALTAATVAAKMPLPTALPDGDAEELRQVLYGPKGPTDLSFDEMLNCFDRAVRNKHTELQRAVDKWKVDSPAAPPRAMVLNDAPNPHRPRVFIRGNPARPGTEIPRRFLRVLAGSDAAPFADGSGRLELARAIVSPDNPLTARVIVNRVWLHHFGSGLVRTPSDFGVRGTPPTHPELLDFLGGTFIDDGWSLKRLHRRILLSQAYQQASHDRPEGLAADPENRLLWKMNRQRLEFEPMRDALLAVAGRLDLTAAGRPVELFTEPFTTRRSVYGLIDRQDLPSVLRSFDFASPDVSTAQRSQTTVPQQALYALNAPFVIEQSRALAARVAGEQTPEAQIAALYRIALSRPPDSTEAEVAAGFLNGTGASAGADDGEQASDSPWQYGWGTYDETAKRIKNFRPLPHFAEGAWRGGAKLPDPQLGWLLLNPAGGHPGQGLDHVVVRRWTAPRAGKAAVAAVLEHPSDKGDGVRGRILSSQKGELGQWTARHGKQDTQLNGVAIAAGETLDFAVDCLGSLDHDAFSWSPVITLSEDGRQPQAWNATTDFRGPGPAPLSRLEQFAQILLLTNEFVFID